MRRTVLNYGNAVTCLKRCQSTTATSVQQPRLSYPPVKGHLQRYNALISRNANQGNLVRVLQLAKELKQQLAASDEKPDHTTYEALARAFAVHGCHREALRVIEDAKAAGLEPDVGIWNQVLRAHIVADQSLSLVIAAMESSNVAHNALTNDLMIQYYVNKRSVEPAVRALIGMAINFTADPSSSRQTLSSSSLDFTRVSKESLDGVFNLVCDVGETRLAKDILKAGQSNKTRTPSAPALHNMVAAGVAYDDPNCIWSAIEALNHMGSVLSEGLSMSVLQNLSRHGLVEACEHVFAKHLRAHNILLQEWHLAPMVTACTAAGELHKAVSYFEQLSALPSHSGEYYKPSHQYFLNGLRHLSALRQMAAHLQTSLENGSLQIPIQFVNAMLAAYRIHRLPEDGIALADRVFEANSGLPLPDIPTFEIMLDYWSESSKPAGKLSSIEQTAQLLSTMQKDRRGLKPSKKIYETLIRIYLQGGEDELLKAFDYLEEMKHFNHMPSSHLYVAILQRLLEDRGGNADDDERIDLVLQEMASLGYLAGERANGRSRLPLQLYDKLGMSRINDIRQHYYAT